MAEIEAPLVNDFKEVELRVVLYPFLILSTGIYKLVFNHQFNEDQSNLDFSIVFKGLVSHVKSEINHQYLTGLKLFAIRNNIPVERIQSDIEERCGILLDHYTYCWIDLFNNDDKKIKISDATFQNKEIELLHEKLQDLVTELNDSVSGGEEDAQTANTDSENQTDFSPFESKDANFYFNYAFSFALLPVYYFISSISSEIINSILTSPDLHESDLRESESELIDHINTYKEVRNEFLIPLCEKYDLDHSLIIQKYCEQIVALGNYYFDLQDE